MSNWIVVQSYEDGHGNWEAMAILNPDTGVTLAWNGELKKWVEVNYE